MGKQIQILGRSFLAMLFTAGLAAQCGDTVSMFEPGQQDDALLPGSSQNVYDIGLEIAAIDSSVEQGNRFAVDILIHNISEQAIEDDFLVSIFASRHDTFDFSTATWLYSLDIGALDGGSTASETALVTIPGNSLKFGTGQWNIFIFADAADEIQEVEEEDNLQGPWPLYVHEATERPDLVFAGIENPLDETAINLDAGGNTVPVAIRIANKGTRSLYKEYFNTRFLLTTLGGDRTYPAGYGNNWDIPVDFELQPNEEFQLISYPDLSDYPDLEPGYYLLWAEIDINDSIVESDETNNAPSELDYTPVYID